ncbi:MAG TPA: hypothetical protein VH370_04370 [Humisphaera sp.]|jgi:hypothetical protein|nr:hypothetical protein [Humisphaera sp.]
MKDTAVDAIELAEASSGALPIEDRRPRVPPPLPVRLETIETAHLNAPAGLERELDEFYQWLGFEREPDLSAIIYRADNERLIFHVVEVPPPREDFRPLGIQVQCLNDIEHALVENKIEFEVQRGVVVGLRSLLLTDPAANWVSISEAPIVW